MGSSNLEFYKQQNQRRRWSPVDMIIPFYWWFTERSQISIEGWKMLSFPWRKKSFKILYSRMKTLSSQPRLIIVRNIYLSHPRIVYRLYDRVYSENSIILSVLVVKWSTQFDSSSSMISSRGTGDHKTLYQQPKSIKTWHDNQ